MNPLAAPVDIFATKGIEYLVILFFLATFLAFWLYFTTDRQEIVRAGGTKIKNLMDWFRVPEGFFFHQGHSWVQEEVGGTLRVGMDDFAQKMVGKISSIDIGNVGTKVKQGEKSWTLKAGNRLIAMLAPVNGEILEVNKDVLADPSLINRDPYGKGWLFKIKADDYNRDSRNLLFGKIAGKWMEGVTEQLHNSLGSEELGPVYQDGGIPIEGMAKHIENENWRYYWEMLLDDYFISREDGRGRGKPVDSKD